MNKKDNISDSTLAYYNANAESISERYEATLPEEPLLILDAMLSPGSRILELGCGSGRDGAFLLNKGYEWYGVEGSPAMAAQAVHLHPRLNSRVTVADFRKPLPFAENSFDGIFSFAALMHLYATEVPSVLSQIYLFLKPKAFLLISVPINRADVGSDGFDSQGRYFLAWNSQQWSDALTNVRFTIEKISKNSDCLGRNVTWLNITAIKTEDTPE